VKPKVDRYGTKRWRLNGKLHRTDGPAVEGADGTKAWFINGKRHREDGPAIERANGSKEWWIKDNLHRADGPAVEYADGSKKWWVNHKQLFKEDFTSLDQIIKMQALELFTPQEIVRLRNGT